MSEQLLLSKREAAGMLGLSVRTLENLLRLKELPSRRVGRRRLIERLALEKFAKRDHLTQPRVTLIPEMNLTKTDSAGPEEQNT